MTFLYLTTNPGKKREAQEVLRDQYRLDFEVHQPNFDVPEIQSMKCEEVAAFSVKYAADRLGKPCLKSDSGLHVEGLGGLPGPFNRYFEDCLGVDSFLHLLAPLSNRRARLRHVFAYCEPGSAPMVFADGGQGTVAHEPRGVQGRWHELFYVPEGHSLTLSELRQLNPTLEAQCWGTAIHDFAKWYAKRNQNDHNPTAEILQP